MTIPPPKLRPTLSKPHALYVTGDTYVLLDESGNGTQARPLITGAVITTCLPELEDAVQNIFRTLSVSPQLEGLRTFEKFVLDGFHFSEDPVEIKTAFLRFLSQLLGFRAFMAFSERARLPSLDDNQRSLVLYSIFLADIIAYSNTPAIHFIFENNSSLDAKFPRLVEDAKVRAKRLSPRRILPAIDVQIAPKRQPMALAIIDYFMAVYSKWIEDGSNRDPKVGSYRSYLQIERNIAVIHDFDTRRRSTRSNREFH